MRTDAGHEGVYDATNETGSWVVTKVAALGAGAGVTEARVQVAGAGNVDVAWAGPDGVFVATRSGGTWGSPVEVSPDPAGSVDLVRSGADRHLVFGRLSAGQPAGVAHALSIGGGPWTIEEVDDGADATPRLARRRRRAPPRRYLRASPEPEVRYATNAGGGWATQVVTRSTWGRPGVRRRCGGHQHVAVARIGEEPGVWYGTDAGGSWTMERVTTTPPDGSVGLVGRAGRDRVHRVRGVGAGRSAWLATGTPGDWTLTKLADRGRYRHPRDRAGRQRVAPRRVRR